MTAIRLARSRGLCGRGWSLAALGLCLVAEAVTLRIILGQGDTSHVRWPLLMVPVVAAAVPVLVPLRSARIVAVVALGGWCLIAILSVGAFFLPALGAMVAALSSGGERT